MGGEVGRMDTCLCMADLKSLIVYYQNIVNQQCAC